MIEKGVRGGIFHPINRYAKANNNYMKNHNKNIEFSHLIYPDANNLYVWAMFQKLPVHDFKWEKNVSKFNEEFIKHYQEDINKGYILEVDVEYPKDLNNLYRDLPFSSERMKIKNYNKLVWNFYDKKEYVAHIRNLKRAPNHGLILK